MTGNDEHMFAGMEDPDLEIDPEAEGPEDDEIEEDLLRDPEDGEKICPNCEGRGRISRNNHIETCPECLGEGIIEDEDYDVGEDDDLDECPKCGGSGQETRGKTKTLYNCSLCNGSGVVTSEESEEWLIKSKKSKSRLVSKKTYDDWKQKSYPTTKRIDYDYWDRPDRKFSNHKKKK